MIGRFLENPFIILLSHSIESSLTESVHSNIYSWDIYVLWKQPSNTFVNITNVYFCGSCLLMVTNKERHVLKYLSMPLGVREGDRWGFCF